jgi:hypothetical protein
MKEVVVFLAGIIGGGVGTLLLVRATWCPNCKQEVWLARFGWKKK